ncbi:unnamed protein product [Leptidea sinapis]|uniref:UDP-glycosyltransferases domain-containing protein n=1 Tax=Leptidea sinapis TaxID=189913 RepID=A0A5E4QM62_9NEOP|nr:unnamed protein product [Leptidea sinapis]
MQVKNIVIILFIAICKLRAARILAVFPTPSISHQVIFRLITHELARRGHEVVVITPDPAFSSENAPENLTEIDVHDLSYNNYEDFFGNDNGNKGGIAQNVYVILEHITSLFEKQLQVPEVKRHILNKNNKFDLILVEAYVKSTLGLGHLLKTPVIQISSLGADPFIYSSFGVPNHLFQYPVPAAQRLYNLSIFEKINELYKLIVIYNHIIPTERLVHEMMKRAFGLDVPTYYELQQNVELLILNEHPVWAHNRPVPSNVIYMGGIHQPPETKLSQQLQKLLDSSKNGVIYVSFGTNVRPSQLPKKKIALISKVLSKLPHDILWKWDQDQLPGQSSNIKTFKWFPQAALLKHPKIKLFITQGGLQSTDEAINAGVPVIGLPMFADQWYNAEKYEHHGIGLQLDIFDLTEDNFEAAVQNKNMLKLRDIMRDYPIEPLDNAVFWIEHVLRHGGSHLRTPVSRLSWVEYYEVTLIIAVLIILICKESIKHAAKILAVFPTPSISHQVVFRPIVQELAKKGHEVIVITPDPAFPKGKSPANLTEIDVHDISYNAMRQDLVKNFLGDNMKFIFKVGESLKMMTEIFEKQLQASEVRDLMNDKERKFDLIIVEAFARAALGFGHFYKAPVIQISSLAYRLYNLSIAEKIFELVRTALYAYIAYPSFEYGHAMMKRNFGKDVPNQVSLQNDVKMLFLNEHPIWSDRHPVPPNIKFLGGIHQTPTKALPQDLKKYLDTSEYGVIYVSFGSNAKPSRIPRDKIDVMIKIFSTLPYDILWKWDADDLPGKSDNINFFKWLPQSDLLKHPNIKIFITQGGLQSTDEAINAAVPLIGIPLFGDQWYNVEKYVHHGIGIKLDILTLTENEFKVALEEILGNKSYRNNILRLRSLMREHPIPPVDMAVWWIEHILRFGSEHLKSPAAGLSLTQYYEIPLVLTIASIIFFILLVIIFIVWYFLHSICYYLKPTKKDQLVILFLFFVFLQYLHFCNSAKILAVFPVPSYSHNLVVRPIFHELLKKGHEVTVLTTHPNYLEGERPENLTEIKLYNEVIHHKIANIVKNEFNLDTTDFRKSKLLLQSGLNLVFDVQLQLDEVKRLFQDKDNKFDLLLLEANVHYNLIFLNRFRVPAIQLGILGGIYGIYESVGANTHRNLYPLPVINYFNPSTIYNEITEQLENIVNEIRFRRIEDDDHQMLCRHFGPTTPTINEMRKSIDMIMLRINSIWDFNRPVPPNLRYIGEINNYDNNELQADIQILLDSSQNGVIYVSFGTSIPAYMLSDEKLNILIKAFASLPFCFIWKLENYIPNLPENIKIGKWFNQEKILGHPNVKLFITHGGLRSTEEAIFAEVPLIGIPMLFDQGFNVEHYVRHNIGVRLDFKTMTADQLIQTVLKKVMMEESITSLDKSVWWIEYVLRHGGAKHLRGPAANMSWTDYYEMELLLLIILFIMSLIYLIFYLVKVFVFLVIILYGRMFYFNHTVLFFVVVGYVSGAKILGVFPTPMISHQLVFRSLMMALVDRGHDVVVVTTDPLYSNGEGPSNLLEIDVHNISYSVWRQHIAKIGTGKNKDILTQALPGKELFNNLYRTQMTSTQVQKMLKERDGFDLIIAESFIKLIIGFSFKYDCPVILISSLGATYGYYKQFGAPNHPLIYPNILRQRLNNLTMTEKISELIIDYIFEWFDKSDEADINIINKNIFINSPSLKELDDKYTQMLFLNTHPIWERIRPVPLNVIHFNDLKEQKIGPLSKELSYFLDTSMNGVIYISFGTNIKTTSLPSAILQTFFNAISKLDQNILLKWDSDTLPGKPDNVYIAKWWPQSAILKHPNVKLFISQSGLTSCQEAIAAGVPIIGIPMIFDQWFNIENIIYYKIGKNLDFSTLSEELLIDTITTIINDKSYRDNVIKLRSNMMTRGPNNELERAIMWTEYVLKHGTAIHLRAPATNISWIQYYELELISICFVFIIALSLTMLCFLKRYMCLNIRKQQEFWVYFQPLQLAIKLFFDL